MCRVLACARVMLLGALLALGVNGAPVVQSPACPSSDQTTFTAPSGNLYVIQCSTDHYGGDLSLVWTDTFEDCIDTCDTTATCELVSYDSGACYMKSQLNPPVTNTAVWGAVLLSVTTELVHTCPSADGDVIAESSGTNYVVQCGIDHYGGDISNTGTDTFDDCIALCDSTSGCIVVSYLSGTCYLKNAVETPLDNSAVWGAIQQAYLPATTTVYTCPDDNGATVTAPSGHQYVIQCGTDHYGGDLNSTITESLDACVDLCDSTSGCLGVSYVGPSPGWCYMKSTITPADANSDVWAAVLSGYVSPSTTTAAAVSTTTTVSTSATPSASSVTCPSGNNTVFNAPNGDQFDIECFVDHYGNDLPGGLTNSFSDCLDLCSTTDGCVAVSWVGPAPGYCYLKSSLGDDIQQDDSVWGAVLASSALSSSSTTSATITTTSSGSATSTTSSTPTTTTTSSTSSTTSTTSSTTSTTSTTSAAASPTNAIANGDFANCQLSPWSLTDVVWPGGVTAKAGNPQTAGVIALTANPSGASCALVISSNYYGGNAGDGLCSGNIEAPLTTVAGVTYSVSFQMVGGGGGGNPYSVSINGGTPFVSGGGGNEVWNSYSTTFVATGNDAIVISVASHAWAYGAWAYDNFVVTPLQ